MSGESITQGLAAGMLPEKDYERLTGRPPTYQKLKARKLGGWRRETSGKPQASQSHYILVGEQGLEAANMASSELDVVSIGNAIVDIMCRCDDAFLSRMGLVKGALRIVNSADELSQIASQFPRRLEIAGGSGSNVAVGVASFGGRSAFVGKVLDDTLGRIFRHDLKGSGVETHVRVDGHPDGQTARSLILITPDGQRTMLTYLGVHTDLGVDLVSPQTMKNAKCLFVEGYLFDVPSSRVTAKQALTFARGVGRMTALALLDPNCVARNRLIFRQIMKSGLDLLIANEAEILSLYQSESFEDAAALVAKDTRQCVLTRGSKGSVVITGGKSTTVSAVAVPKVVDATGAGDMFIAGLLFGLCRGRTLEQAAKLGSFAAAEIISQVSARPEVRLSHSARLRGLLV